jgi:cyclic-di-GMP phosphodiesterase, flagellum assembly factor TipF
MEFGAGDSRITHGGWGHQMVRLSAIFIGFCMVLIAISVGVVLYLAFGLGGPEATIVAIGALTALALYDAVARQLRNRALFSDQITNLSRGTTDLAWQVGDLTRQVAESNRRMAAIERKTELPLERMRTAIPAFASEIEELGSIVKQLAEAVAAREAALATQQPAVIEDHTPFHLMSAGPVKSFEITVPAERIEMDEPASLPEPMALTETTIVPEAVSPEAMIELVRTILDAKRADIYLQPVVTLPQRKIRYYEALTRLRGEDGELLLPTDFIDAAEAGGLMARIDQSILTRAAQVVRWLLQKNRDIGLICNISAYTLADPNACRQLQDFFDANQELAGSLVLEFRQSVWRAMSPYAHNSIEIFAKLGVRFSLDHVTDLRIEPQELAERGVKLVKIPAQVLLGAADRADLDIHPTDLSNLMARHGISLIAERIESESTVLELFEYDVRFAQGYLFSPPRPVRPEAMQVSEDSAERKAAPKPQVQAAPAGKTLASAVDEIRRAGILPQPVPGGSNA